MGKKGYELSPTLQLLRDPKGKSAHQISRIIAKWQIRNIKNRRINRPTEEFMKDLRLDIKTLGWHNNEEFRRTGKYPRSKFLFKLLQQYVALEYQYMSENHLSTKDTIHYVLDLLKTFLNDYFGNRTEHTKYFLLYILNSSQRRFNLPQKYCRTLISKLRDDMYFDNSMIRKLENLRKRKKVMLIDEVYFNPSYQDAVSMDDYGTESESDSDELSSESTLWATHNQFNNSRFKKRQTKKSHDVKHIIPKPEIVDLLSDDEDDVICLGSELNAENLFNIQPSKLNARREEKRKKQKHAVNTCDNMEPFEIKPRVPCNFFTPNNDSWSKTNKLIVTSIVSGIGTGNKNQEENLTTQKHEEVSNTNINRPVLSTEKLPVISGDERSTVRTKGERKVYTRRRSRSNSSDSDCQNNQQKITKTLPESGSKNSASEIVQQLKEALKLLATEDSNLAKTITILDDVALHSLKPTESNTHQKQEVPKLLEAVTVGTSQLFQERDTSQSTYATHNKYEPELSSNANSECLKEKELPLSLSTQEPMCEKTFQGFNKEETQKNELLPHISSPTPCEPENSQIGKKITSPKLPKRPAIEKETRSCLQEKEGAVISQLKQDTLLNESVNQGSQEFLQRADFSTKNQSKVEVAEKEKVTENILLKDNTKFETSPENIFQNLDKRCDQEPGNTSLEVNEVPNAEKFQMDITVAKVVNHATQQVLDSDTPNVVQPNEDVFLNDVTEQKSADHLTVQVLTGVVSPPSLEENKHCQIVCVLDELKDSSTKEIKSKLESETAKQSLQEKPSILENVHGKMCQSINNMRDRSVDMSLEDTKYINVGDTTKNTLDIENEVEACLDLKKATFHQEEGLKESEGVNLQSSDKKFLNTEVKFKHIEAPPDSIVDNEGLLQTTLETTTPAAYHLCDQEVFQKETKVQKVTNEENVSQPITIQESVVELLHSPEGKPPVNSIDKVSCNKLDENEISGDEIVESDKDSKDLPVPLRQEETEDFDKEKGLENTGTAQNCENLSSLQETSICQNTKEGTSELLENQLLQFSVIIDSKDPIHAELLEKDGPDSKTFQEKSPISEIVDALALSENKVRSLLDVESIQQVSCVVEDFEKETTKEPASPETQEELTVEDQTHLQQSEELIQNIQKKTAEQLEDNNIIQASIEEEIHTTEDSSAPEILEEKVTVECSVEDPGHSLIISDVAIEEVSTIKNVTVETRQNPDAGIPTKEPGQGLDSFQDSARSELLQEKATEQNVPLKDKEYSEVEDHRPSIVSDNVIGEVSENKNMTVETPQNTIADIPIKQSLQVLDSSCESDNSELPLEKKTEEHLLLKNKGDGEEKDSRHSINISEVLIEEALTIKNMIVENLTAEVPTNKSLQVLDLSRDSGNSEIFPSMATEENILLNDKDDVKVINHTDDNSIEVTSDKNFQQDQSKESPESMGPPDIGVSNKITNVESTKSGLSELLPAVRDNEESTSDQVTGVKEKTLMEEDNLSPLPFISNNTEVEKSVLQLGTATNTCLPISPSKASQDSQEVPKPHTPLVENLIEEKVLGDQVILESNEENMLVGEPVAESIINSAEIKSAIVADELNVPCLLVKPDDEISLPASSTLPVTKSRNRSKNKSKVTKERVFKGRSQKTLASTVALSKDLKNQEYTPSQILKISETQFTMPQNQKFSEPNITGKLSPKGKASTNNKIKKTLRGCKSGKPKQKRNKSAFVSRKRTKKSMVLKMSEESLSDLESIAANVSNSHVKVTPIDNEKVLALQCTPIEVETNIVPRETVIETGKRCPPNEYTLTSRDSFKAEEDMLKSKKLHVKQTLNDDIHFSGRVEPYYSIQPNAVMQPTQVDDGSHKNFMEFLGGGAPQTEKIRSPKSNCDDSNLKILSMVAASIVDKNVKLPATRRSRKGQRRDSTRITRSSAKTQRSLQSQFPESVMSNDDSCDSYDKLVINCDDTASEQESVDERKNRVVHLMTEKNLEVPMKKLNDNPIQPEPVPDVKDYISQHTNISYVGNSSPANSDEKHIVRTKGELKVYTEPRLRSKSCDVKASDPVPVQRRSSDDLPYNICNILRENTLSDDLKSPKLKTRWEAQNIAETSSLNKEAPNLKIETNIVTSIENSELTVSISQHESELVDKKIESQRKVKTNKSKKSKDDEHAEKTVKGSRRSSRDKKQTDLKTKKTLSDPVKNVNKDDSRQETKKKGEDIRTRPKTRSGKYEGPYVFEEDEETQSEETDTLEGDPDKLSNKKIRDKKRSRSKIKEESKVSKIKDNKEICKQVEGDCSDNEMPQKIYKTSNEAIESTKKNSSKKECSDVKIKKGKDKASRSRSRSKTEKNVKDKHLIDKSSDGLISKVDKVKVIDKPEIKRSDSPVKCVDEVNEKLEETILEEEKTGNKLKAAEKPLAGKELHENLDDVKESKISHVKSKKDQTEISSSTEVDRKKSVDIKAKKPNHSKKNEVEEKECEEELIKSEVSVRIEEKKMSTAENKAKKHSEKKTLDVDEKATKCENFGEILAEEQDKPTLIAEKEGDNLCNKDAVEIKEKKCKKKKVESKISNKVGLEGKTSIPENKTKIQCDKETIPNETELDDNKKEKTSVVENKEEAQFNTKGVELVENQCNDSTVEKRVDKEKTNQVDAEKMRTLDKSDNGTDLSKSFKEEKPNVNAAKEKQIKVDAKGDDKKSTNKHKEKKKCKENFTNTEEISENTHKNNKSQIEKKEKPEELVTKPKQGEVEKLNKNICQVKENETLETTKNDSMQLEKKEEKHCKQKSRSHKKAEEMDEKEPKSKRVTEKNNKEKEKNKKSDSHKKGKEKVVGEKEEKSKEKFDPPGNDEKKDDRVTADSESFIESNDQNETSLEKEEGEEETVKDFSRQFNEIYKYARNSIKKNEELLTQHRDLCIERKASDSEITDKCSEFKTTEKGKQKNSSSEKNLTEVTQKNFESFMKDLIKERKITQCKKTEEEEGTLSTGSSDEKKHELEEIIPDDKNKNKALQQTVERMKSRLDQKRQLQEAIEKEKKKRKIANTDDSSKTSAPGEIITANDSEKTSDESQSGVSSGDVSSSSSDNISQTRHRRKLKLNKYKVHGKQDSEKNGILAFVFYHKKSNRRPTMRRPLWRHPFVEDHELAHINKKPRGSARRIKINEIIDKLRSKNEPKRQETRQEDAPKVIVQRIPQSDDVFPDFIGIDGVLPVGAADPNLPESSKADDHKIGRYSIKPTTNIGVLGGPFLSAQVTAKSTENLAPTKLETSREGCDDSPVEVMLNLPEHTEQYLVGNGPPSQENPNDFPLTDQFFGFDHSIQDVCLIEPNGDNIPLQNICKEETVDFFTDQRLEEIAEQEITNQVIADQEIPDQYMSIGTMTELLLTVNGETSNSITESDSNYIGEPTLNYIEDPGTDYATRPNEVCSTDNMPRANRIDPNSGSNNDQQNKFDFELWMSQNLFKNQDAPIVQDNNTNNSTTIPDTLKQPPIVNQQDITGTSTTPPEKPKRKGRKSSDYPPVKRKQVDETNSSSATTAFNELIFKRYPRTRVCAPKKQEESTKSATINSYTSTSKQATNNTPKVNEKKVEDTLLLPTPPIVVDQSSTKPKSKSPRKQDTPTKSEDMTAVSIMSEDIATVDKEPTTKNDDSWPPTTDKIVVRSPFLNESSGRSSNVASVLTENRTKIWNPIGTPPRRKRKHSEQEPPPEPTNKYHSEQARPETPPKKQRRPSINIRDDIFEHSSRDSRKSTAPTSSFYEPPSSSSGRRTSMSPIHMNPFSDDRRTTPSTSNYSSSPSANNRRTSISPTHMNSLFDQVRNSDPNNVPLPRNPYENYKLDSRDSRPRQRRRSNDEPDRKNRQTYKPETRRRYHQVVDPQEVSESFRKKTSGFRESNFRQESSHRPRNVYDTDQMHQHALPAQALPQMSNSHPMSMPTLQQLRHTMPYERRRESPPRQLSMNPYSYSNGYPRHWQTQNYEGRPMSNIAEGNPRKEQQKQETIKKFWSWLEKGCQPSNKKE